AAPRMMTTLLCLFLALTLTGLFTLAPASSAQSPGSDAADLPRACDIDRDAQSCLKQAIRLYEGKKLSKDDLTARRFAAKACAEGAAEGCNFLAAMLEKGIGGPADRQAAVRNYRRACSAGYANACYNLGQLFYYAAANESEVVQARALFAEACDAKIADSCKD